MKSLSRPRADRLLRALPQLGEDAVSALRVNERDLRAARADLRFLIDQRCALRLELRERADEIVDLDADVMQALAALLEKLRHARARVGRTDQLDATHAVAEDRRAHFLIGHDLQLGR